VAFSSIADVSQSSFQKAAFPVFPLVPGTTSGFLVCSPALLALENGQLQRADGTACPTSGFNAVEVEAVLDIG
jgi:hypothetical protein